jgi:post-segregation antitoxin (ccd killing protein)
MARLNITIPDELYAALEPWRDHINISRVCQDALAREVAKLNDLPRQAAELAALVERMQREKASAEKFAFGQGLTDSVAWARGASYAELRRWGELDGSSAPRAGANGALEAALQRHSHDPTFDESAYREGWLMGAGEVWQRVRDKV